MQPHLTDNSTPDILIIRTTDNDEALDLAWIIHANRGAADLLGYTTEELINQPLELIVSGNCTNLWSTLHITDKDNCIEAELIGKSRQTIPAFISVSGLPSPSPGFSDTLLLIQAANPTDDMLVMRRVIEQSASAMLITDSSGLIEYVNPKFSELTGYSSAELIGRNPRVLQSGNMSAEYYQTLWTTLLQQGSWQGEIQNKHKNGSDYWLYESISAIKNPAGKITHFLAVDEDITQRKQVEGALQESEERFRQMAELSGEWLWEQDPNGYYLYSSIAVEQILGFSQQQIIGKHYASLLTSQDQQTHIGFSTNQHAFHAVINHYQHRDGHQVWTESTGLPLFNTQGKLLKWRGVDRDITARMTFQQALIDSEKRTRLIIESSINAIVIMDAYGIITDWNQPAVKMFGWSVEEAIGQRLDELIIPPRLHSAHRKGLMDFLQTGTGPILNRQIEQTALRRNGSEFPVELSVSPLKVGNSYIFSGFIHDISTRKATEQQIRQAQVNLAIAHNEINIAQRIQASLLPSSPITADDFEISGYCLPANNVGGDYYDYFFRDDNHLDIVIADVSGHSIGSGLFMVETRSAIRIQNQPTVTPGETMSALNNFLFNDLDKADYFITLFYMQVDVAGQHLRYTNAGHPPPLLFNHLSGELTELDADGLILGIRANVVFEEKLIKLRAGDVILFYTDGLLEAENPDQEFFQLERIKTIFRETAHDSPQAIIQAIFTGLQAFCERSSFEDDISLMVFKWY